MTPPTHLQTVLFEEVRRSQEAAIRAVQDARDRSRERKPDAQPAPAKPASGTQRRSAGQGAPVRPKTAPAGAAAAAKQPAAGPLTPGEAQRRLPPGHLVLTPAEVTALDQVMTAQHLTGRTERV